MRLILCNIRSLYNVGSIFRSAAAAGCEHIYLCGLTPKPPRHELEKTALGGTEAVDWSYYMHAEEAIIDAKQLGYSVAALELTDQATSLFAQPLPAKLALIVGHERSGIEASVLQSVPIHYKIPLANGPIHSLNVANATAIALFEYRRQYPL